MILSWGRFHETLRNCVRVLAPHFMAQLAQQMCDVAYSYAIFWQLVLQTNVAQLGARFREIKRSSFIALYSIYVQYMNVYIVHVHVHVQCTCCTCIQYYMYTAVRVQHCTCNVYVQYSTSCTASLQYFSCRPSFTDLGPISWNPLTLAKNHRLRQQIFFAYGQRISRDNFLSC